MLPYSNTGYVKGNVRTEFLKNCNNTNYKLKMTDCPITLQGV